MDRRLETPHLRAYLLRFWKVSSMGSHQAPIWRFSLEDPHTGDKLGFADLEALFAFLQAELTEDAPAAKP
jgi:hypothetical protein